MDEYIDIVTKSGKPTGEKALKSYIHKNGLLHNTAHIWLYTKQGDILLQQRSKTKLIYPLLWDVSVAGHIEAGETITAGALREIKEEIGLNLKENHLTKVGVFESFKNYGNGCTDNEFHHTFTAVLTVDVDDLKPQAEEVEDLKLVTIAEFETLLQNSEHNGYFVATNDAYYLKILQSIKQYVN